MILETSLAFQRLSVLFYKRMVMMSLSCIIERGKLNDRCYVLIIEHPWYKLYYDLSEGLL